MIQVQANEFKAYVSVNFDQADTKVVYDFYRLNLVVDKNNASAGYAKQGFQKKKYENSNSRRLKHLTYLLDNYSKTAVLASIKIFSEKLERGEIDNPTMNYFGGFVKNAYEREIIQASKKTISQPKQAAPEQKPEVEVRIVIPVPYQKVTERFDNRINNWDFSCDCGEVVGPYQGICTNCNAKFNWDKVSTENL